MSDALKNDWPSDVASLGEGWAFRVPILGVCGTQKRKQDLRKEATAQRLKEKPRRRGKRGASVAPLGTGTSEGSPSRLPYGPRVYMSARESGDFVLSLR